MPAHNFTINIDHLYFLHLNLTEPNKEHTPREQELLHTKIPLPGVWKPRSRFPLGQCTGRSSSTLQTLVRTRTLRSVWHIRGRGAMDGVRLSHTGCSAGGGGRVSRGHREASPPQQQHWADLLHCHNLSVSVGKLWPAREQRHWILFYKHMESFPTCSFHVNSFLKSH